MRPAGQMKMGYYPADPELAAQIGRMLVWPEGKRATVLDPSCGCGEALEAFVPPPWREDEGRRALYGVELARNRAESAKTRLGDDHVLYGGFEQCRISDNCFSACWCNPPYDDELGGGKRTELEFLQRVTPLLVDGGILVLFCSYKANTPRLGEFLRAHYDTVKGWKHPPTDRPGYSYLEVHIIIGRKRKQAVLADEKGSIPVEEWPADPPQGWWLPVPPGRHPRMWDRCGCTDEELAEMADASPLFRADPRAVLHLGAPLLPLKLGHIPMVLASGRLNGVIGDHVARAKITKTWVTIKSAESEDGRKVYDTQRQKVSLTIRCLAKREGKAGVFDFA